ncbi:MAG: type II toxin-antitoxin system Phd/YefM family antitoxin [Egibacteraceae bacterium]
MRELKQRLSECLGWAAQGEIIRITGRGRPKAVLGPAQRADVRGHSGDARSASCSASSRT